MIAATDLCYIILPTERLTPVSAQLLESAFRLWSDVWIETFRELGVERRLNSDDFTRQTRIGCLFLADRCVALTCYRSADFSSPAARLDSYFDCWPDEAIGGLCRDGTNILVGSYVTVAAELRGKQALSGGQSVKNLVGGLVVAMVLDSGADAMSGTMRCNRGMDNLARQFGATSLRTGVPHYGVEVELVAFYRRELLKLDILQEHPAIQALWRDRLDYAGNWGVHNPS